MENITELLIRLNFFSYTMTHSIRRTKKTNLSDEELFLFDSLFDSNYIVSSLFTEFNELRTESKAHRLSNVEFLDIVNKLVTKRLMRFELIPAGKKLKTTVSLTSEGGKVWEREREPIWEKYVMDLCLESKGSLKLDVISPSYETAQKFVETCHECKLYELKNLADIHCDQIYSKKTYIPWKRFNKLYKISGQLLTKSKITEIDWQIYRNSQDWWRSILELEQFRKKATK